MGNHNPFGLIDSFSDGRSFIHSLQYRSVIIHHHQHSFAKQPTLSRRQTERPYSEQQQNKSRRLNIYIIDPVLLLHIAQFDRPTSQPPRLQPSPLPAQSTSSTRTALNAPSSSPQTLVLRASPSSSSPAPRPPTRPSQPAGLATGTPSLREPPMSQVCSERHASTASLAPPTLMSPPSSTQMTTTASRCSSLFTAAPQSPAARPSPAPTPTTSGMTSLLSAPTEATSSASSAPSATSAAVVSSPECPVNSSPHKFKNTTNSLACLFSLYSFLGS